VTIPGAKKQESTALPVLVQYEIASHVLRSLFESRAPPSTLPATEPPRPLGRRSALSGLRARYALRAPHACYNKCMASHTVIACCSCRNRHCSKCQGSQALAWMEERKAELLEVPYFHVVFTLPAEIGAIAYQNKAVIYDLLFKASSDTMLTIAADPKHFGAKIGITAVPTPGGLR
jgi:Transposase zinc-binding domain